MPPAHPPRTIDTSNTAWHAGSTPTLVGGAPLDTTQKYLARMPAIADTRRNRPVISHWSAAALHGLPALGGWPATVHITTAPTSTARSRNGVVKHALVLSDADITEIGGILVTSVERTILDIAVAAPFMTAVVMADHALLIDRFARTPPLTTRRFANTACARSVMACRVGVGRSPSTRTC